MRTRALLLSIIFPAVLLLSGCVVTQTVYLNQIDVKGPIAAPPLNPRIDPDPPAVQITPRVAFTGMSEMKGRYTISSTNVMPRGNGNLTWKLPSAEFGLDMLWMTGRNFGLNFGTTLSTVGGSSQSVWRFGLHYSSLKEGTGFALDGGLQWSTLYVRAQTLIITEINSIFGSGRYVDYFDDSGNSTGLGGYLGLTVSSAIRESRMNFFVNGGVVWQPILGYTAQNRDLFYGPGDRFVISPALKKSLAFLSLTPGLTFEMGETSRILVGGRILFPLDIENQSPGLLIHPVVQCSFGL